VYQVGNNKKVIGNLVTQIHHEFTVSTVYW